MYRVGMVRSIDSRPMGAARPLVVLPTYNEAGSLPLLVRGILAEVPEASILVVDDASPDGTGAWVRNAAGREPRLRLLERPHKAGLGSALREGWDLALREGWDPILTMDADGSHQPRFLPLLLQALERADLAVGSRYCPGGSVRDWPWSRRFLSRTANRLTRAVLGLPVRDATSGFRAFRASALRALEPEHILAEGYSFLEETLWRAWHAGCRIEEVPIEFVDRRLDQSKISRGEILRAAGTLLRLRWSRPPVQRRPAPRTPPPPLP